MATDTQNEAAGVGRLKLPARQALWDLTNEILANHLRFNEFQDKLDIIDMAYARYTETNKTFTDGNGVDSFKSAAGAEECGNVFASDKVVPPIVVAQVDTYVAYLAEVFLSGTPLFPVVASPVNRTWAEQLETLLDDHAAIGGYVRQLLMFFRDGVKYNYSAIEVDWTYIEEFTVQGSISTGTGKAVNRGKKKYNELRRLNPRNVLRDMTVDVGDISRKGDYAGYVEYVSKNQCRQELNKFRDMRNVYNYEQILSGTHPDWRAGSAYYRDDPRISEYISVARMDAEGPVDWNKWFQEVRKGRDGDMLNTREFGAKMERICLYLRLTPAEYGLPSPMQHVPQIYKVVWYNGHLATCQRILTAYNYLPILFCQPHEDGLRYQTQSVAEGEIPFQEAAGTLFNIRFAAARRAVSDRALYDVEHLTSKAVNSKGAAPKIPVRLGTLSKKTLSDIYLPIPFDSRGLETVLQDAQVITNFSKELHGGNNPRQGQFQKGNKSVQEWNDTMAGSDNRYRLPAMTIEDQVMSPMRSIMVMNIFLEGDNVAVVSQRSGEILNIDIDKLRQQVLSFQMTDGYTPKSKKASTDVLLAGLQTIQASPVLQQAYGNRLPGMFAHFMSLSGLKGFDQYDPAVQQPAPPPTGLKENTLGPGSTQAPAAIPPVTVPPSEQPILPPGYQPPGA